jgi:hypothetical protein
MVYRRGPLAQLSGERVRVMNPFFLNSKDVRSIARVLFPCGARGRNGTP